MKKAAFALPQKQVAGKLPEVERLEGAATATVTATTMEMTTTALTKTRRTTKTKLFPLGVTSKTKSTTTKSRRFPLLLTMAGIRREVA